jgi:predicted nucleotidyltransferase
MGTKYDIERIPPSHRSDVEKAVKILEGAGCREIYLFGSIVSGPVTPESDIDLAVKGIPPASFFEIYGKLIGHLDHPVDLVDLESGDRFSHLLETGGHLHRVI